MLLGPARDVDVLEDREERTIRVPRGFPGRGRDVVPVQRRDGNHVNLLGPKALQKLASLVLRGAKSRLTPERHVHLVHCHDEVTNPHGRGDHGVTTALLEESLPRIDQKHRDLGVRCGRRHVARVLFVPRGVGHDETAPSGTEVTVGDIDGDALLALRFQSVQQSRELDRTVGELPGQSFSLIFRDAA